MEESRCWRRLLASALGVLLLVSACAPPEQSTTGTAQASEQAEAEDTAEETAERSMARGVALSPISYDGTDLPDFLEIVDGSVDLLMHAADWGELADETSAFRVLSELAAPRNLDTMIVLSPSNGTGLLRPLDEATVDSYLASLRTFLADYQPRYLALGNELNLVASRSTEDFEQTVALYDAALTIVRQASPETRVLVTFQYEWLIGRRDGWFGRENDPSASQWDLLDRFADADAIGITTYPGLVHEHPDDIKPDYYAQLRAHTDLPVVITESGWSAHADSADLAGSEDEQVAFAMTMLERAEQVEAQAVVWTFLFSTQVAEPAFADMGLWRDDGTPRPAWLVWTSALEPTRGTAVAPTNAVPTQPVPPAELPPPTQLVERWTVPFPGELPLTTVADTKGRPFVYVAAKNGGVAVISTAGEQGTIVARVGSGALGADAMHVTQQADTLVVALGDFFSRGNRAGLAVIDVADPTNPVLAGTWLSSEATHGAADVIVDGTVAYLAAMEHGILAVDIADPANPKLVGQLRPDPDFPKPNPSDVARPNARGLAVADGILYVANDAGGLRTIDVTEPTNMREVGRYINQRATKQQAYNDVLVVGENVFVSLDYCGFEIVDVTAPASMNQVAWLDPWGCNDLTNLWLNSAGHGNELFYDPDRSTVYMSAGDSEVLAIDVTDLANPTVATSLGEPGNDRGTYGLGATTGPEPQIFATYITTIVPFQGRSAEVVAVTPKVAGS